MAKKLRKFRNFASTLFPSEIIYVTGNNNFKDPELHEILNRLVESLDSHSGKLNLDESIDPRKYSKLKLKFTEILNKIDVDNYYQWISKINSAIITDSISPSEQTKILVEMKNFSPTWFHAHNFFHAIVNYRHYLLMRNREKDFKSVEFFLNKHRSAIEKNQKLLDDLGTITEQISFGNSVKFLKEKELDFLREILKDENLSKYVRYTAWLSFNMYFINIKSVSDLIEPMKFMEKKIYEGSFYSRRILSNFYANKLLIYSRLKKYEEADLFGSLSIKHQTQDYLYYINNYCSVKLILKKYKEAVEIMNNTYKWYIEARNNGSRLIFICNYCRSLIKTGQERKAIRLARLFEDELKNQIFQFQWNYFYRTYFEALFIDTEYRKILDIIRRKSLVEKEKEIQHAAYIMGYKTVCDYMELKISEGEYLKALRSLEQEGNFENKSIFTEFISTFPLSDKINREMI